MSKDCEKRLGKNRPQLCPFGICVCYSNALSRGLSYTCTSAPTVRRVINKFSNDGWLCAVARVLPKKCVPSRLYRAYRYISTREREKSGAGKQTSLGLVEICVRGARHICFEFSLSLAASGVWDFTRRTDIWLIKESGKASGENVYVIYNGRALLCITRKFGRGKKYYCRYVFDKRVNHPAVRRSYSALVRTNKRRVLVVSYTISRLSLEREKKSVENPIYFLRCFQPNLGDE